MVVQVMTHSAAPILQLRNYLGDCLCEKCLFVRSEMYSTNSCTLKKIKKKLYNFCAFVILAAYNFQINWINYFFSC